LAISPAFPIRPGGTPAASPALSRSASSLDLASPSTPGVPIGQGPMALTRIFRSSRSMVQVRANERTAALVAL
jgi:hypothetical protein